MHFIRQVANEGQINVLNEVLNVDGSSSVITSGLLSAQEIGNWKSIIEQSIRMSSY